jgi:GNAT superfamily N-acetyltransferase
MNPQAEHLEASLPPRPGAGAPWFPIRQLHERHRTRVLNHLLGLGEADRRLRFGHTAGDEQIRQYVQRLDFERDELFGVFDSRLRLVAMAHLALDQGSAEFGVSVSERQRGRGIGARLFEHAVTHARNQGSRELTIYLARENHAMLHIVQKAGARVRFEGSDAVAVLAVPPQTLGSQLSALIEDRAAEIDYRWKMQVLRLDRLLSPLRQSPPS